MVNAKRRTRKDRTERITILPRFKPGRRVTWSDGTRKLAGEVRDTHTLGGHGRAYEVLADGETLPDEITENELSPEPPHEHPALRELLETLRLVIKPRNIKGLVAAREKWVAAGCPGV